MDSNIQSKKGTAYFHTQKRLRERYGLEMTRNEYMEMCRGIKKNIYKRIIIAGDQGGLICKYEFKNVEIAIAFDPETNSIRTVYPRSALSRLLHLAKIKRKNS